MVCYPVSQERVAVKKESSLCDTVGLVVELLGHHLVEVLKLSLFKDLCVRRVTNSIQLTDGKPTMG